MITQYARVFSDLTLLVVFASVTAIAGKARRSPDRRSGAVCLNIGCPEYACDPVLDVMSYAAADLQRMDFARAQQAATA
jgi:hypothetical protein